MKLIITLLTLSCVVLASCGSSETKTDSPKPELETKIDSVSSTTMPKESQENIKENTATKSGQSRGIEINPSDDPAKIIAKIDDYLVSSAQYTVGASGGIQNCTVTITNSLPDVSFQKVLVEVSIQKDDTLIIKTDYYTVINIDPGMSKLVKIPNTLQGTKVITRIIKIKSNELTKGEWVLAGSRFVAPD